MHEIRPGDKLLILGMNRSGKSVLMQSIARSWYAGPLVVLDTKGDDPAALVPNSTLCYWTDDVLARLPGRVIWRPTLEEKARHKPGDNRRLRPLWCRFEEVCSKLLELARTGQGPALLVVHELREVCTEQSIGPVFRECITAGGSSGLTLALATQRPLRVALEARSEAQHVVCFTLTDPAARREAAALLEDPAQPELTALVRQRSLPLDHTWWYRDPLFRLSYHLPIRWRP